jgi:hypothetical protein
MAGRKPSARKPAATAATVAAISTNAAPASPPAAKRTIALVYDFDGTLSPKPMQEYSVLPKIGIDPEAFWAESNRIAR